MSGGCFCSQWSVNTFIITQLAVIKNVRMPRFPNISTFILRELLWSLWNPVYRPHLWLAIFHFVHSPWVLSPNSIIPTVWSNLSMLLERLISEHMQALVWDLVHNYQSFITLIFFSTWSVFFHCIMQYMTALWCPLVQQKGTLQA